ncbi:MAG: glycoside hydrolase family protein [Bacteroidales bacterium]|nr:glycoside hydrolase family protein [Bacteroidales bacterium]
MMDISKSGLNFIKKWEGGPWLQAKRFGSERYLSIGYGHYGPDVKIGQTITQAEAEELLKKDVQNAVNHVNYMNNKYAYNFNQNEFDALVSFAYNIGSINQLTANGTRSKKVIAEKMLLYVKSCGVTLQGLVNRRKAENKLFLTKVTTNVPVNESPKTKKKSNTAIAKEVIKGLWGNGVTRKKRLTEAGYNYTEIQKLVNKMLKESK